MKYKTIKQFALESGYTIEAIKTKIKRGVWPEGLVWTKAPDNKRLINVDGFYEWVEQNTKELRAVQNPPLKSHSDITAGNAGKPLSSSPPPLI